MKSCHDKNANEDASSIGSNPDENMHILSRTSDIRVNQLKNLDKDEYWIHPNLQTIVIDVEYSRNKYYCITGFQNNHKIMILILIITLISQLIIERLTIRMPAKDTYVKAVWRVQGCAIANLIIVFLLYMFAPSSRSIKSDFIISNLGSAVVMALYLTAWATVYMIDCSLTVMSHTDVKYSSSCFWIFTATVLMYGVVDKFKIYCYLFYCIGVALMFVDSSASKTCTEGQSYLGDLIAFCGTGSCVIFSYFNKRVKLNFHPIVISVQCYTASTLMLVAVSAVLTDSELFFSFDAELGAFGWLRSLNSVVLVLLVNGLLTGVIVNIGLLCAFEYFSLQTVSVVMLLKPFIAQVAAIVLGYDEVPGVFTLIGLLIIVASFFVIGH